MTARWILLALLAGNAAAAGPAPESTLRWKARDQTGTYGYLIYRSEAEAGPFRRINARIVPKRSDPDAGYVYVDRDVAPGKTYYYRIDGVSEAGIKKPLSPVLPKTIGPNGAPAKTR
ncbi:MAG TPA: fibronectin type III domain-containing protein [Dokdonella sp.]|uniref:fibronectin type III domain-containing protein n=1 Tax=Dokdonella sp. TaxID=2291710 RepID=UPI002D0F4188|nr:fibronectin type III domain-containing protein [Dokdonella sp.]HUD41475.1 fibronectin type III domain-containing protein [Dokdonella sp.]